MTRLDNVRVDNSIRDASKIDSNKIDDTKASIGMRDNNKPEVIKDIKVDIITNKFKTLIVISS